MDIRNVAVNLRQIAFKATPKSNTSLLNQPIEDKVTISRPTLKQAETEVKKMKTPEGFPRFSGFDFTVFNSFYPRGEMDLDVIRNFADSTKFDMTALKHIYDTGTDTKTLDFQNVLKEKMKEFGENQEFLNFEQNLYNPEKGFSIETREIKDEKKLKELTKNLGKTAEDNELKLTIEDSIAPRVRTAYEKDENGNFNVVEKSVIKTYYGGENGKELRKSTTTEDFKKEIQVEKEEALDSSGNFRILSMTSVKNDKNGKMIQKEEMKESEIPGLYNVNQYLPDGKKVEIAKAGVDPKTGITSIKRDVKSDDGTRTEFLYEDDPVGNKIIDYKITDKDGNVLMKNSKSFEVVSENKFVSADNDKKYEITTDEKTLHVKDLNSNKEATIDFEQKIKGDKTKLIEMFKKVPGEELFNAVETVKKIYAKDDSKVMNSYYQSADKSMRTGSSLFVFLHELGHAKDFKNRTKKDSSSSADKLVYTNNPNIKEKYFEEKENFIKNHPDIHKEEISYFIQEKYHNSGVMGGLQELVAETNALTNTHADRMTISLGDRSQLVQQYFPKTIAEIKKAM